MDKQHIKVTKTVGQSSRKADINAMGREWADKNRAVIKHSSHEKALGKAKHTDKKKENPHQFSPVGSGAIAGKHCMTCGRHKDYH